MKLLGAEPYGEIKEILSKIDVAAGGRSFASALPRPLQYIAHTQLGSQLLLFGIPALLVAGVLQLNWEGDCRSLLSISIGQFSFTMLLETSLGGLAIPL